MSSPGVLLEHFKNSNLRGFIREYRNLYPKKPGAVSLWQDLAVKAGSILPKCRISTFRSGLMEELPE